MIRKWKRRLVFLCLGVVGASVSLPAGAAGAAHKASAPRAERAVKAAKTSPAPAAEPARRTIRLAAQRSAARTVPGRGEDAPIRLHIRPPAVVAVPPPSAREPVVLPVSIGEDVVAARPAKVVPARVYAVDGSSFYQNGQLVRIQGLRTLGGGELDKQRLQQMLDAGAVSVAPVSEPTGPALLAVVRVNGQDVADLLNGSQ